MTKINLTMWERGLSLLAVRIFVRQGKMNQDNIVSMTKVLDTIRFNDKEKKEFNIKIINTLETGWEQIRDKNFDFDFDFSEDLEFLKKCVQNVPIAEAEDSYKLLDLWDKLKIDYKGKNRMKKASD